MKRRAQRWYTGCGLLAILNYRGEGLDLAANEGTWRVPVTESTRF